LVQPLQLDQETGQGHLVALTAIELDPHEFFDLAAAEQPATQWLWSTGTGFGIKIAVVGAVLHGRPRSLQSAFQRPHLRVRGIP
jgi:hypothetical protein